jgi:hypothetical protein
MLFMFISCDKEKGKPEMLDVKVENKTDNSIWLKMTGDEKMEYLSPLLLGPKTEKHTAKFTENFPVNIKAMIALAKEGDPNPVYHAVKVFEDKNEKRVPIIKIIVVDMNAIRYGWEK